MKKYELMVIFGSQLKEEDFKKETAKLEESLKAEQAANIVVDSWGLKKFAYPIDYKNEGYYTVINFESDSQVPGKIGAALKVNENVVRYQFISK